ncbi:hypothetical protein [Caballeronia hypogeia]|uniref:hypothetical protein n=1 Tax=Caballeronia hypogeia TaxID=1777140 RepID=UPI0012FE2959|nr:hypothetical protein [Caballeronia hypogeia]
MSKTKIVVLGSFILTVASVDFSYAAYAADLAVSNLPWQISLMLMLGCCVGSSVLCLCFGRGDRLAVYGLIGSVGIFATYHLFGIVPYFYFFMFADIPSVLRWAGLALGTVLTTFWIWLIARNVRYTINHTRFVAAAFKERGDGVIRYEVQRGMRIFEKHYVEPSPLPKPLAYVVFAIAPFCLVLPRILTSAFGTNGVLLVLAALGLPMSLWLIGLLVRMFLVTVVLPLRIERERKMRVIVDA